MNVNPLSINLEKSVVSYTPNDIAQSLHKQGKYEKKVSESQPIEIIKKDKVESSNEVIDNKDSYTKASDKNTKETELNSDELYNLIKEAKIKYEKTDTGEAVTRVVDKDGNVIRQIPSEVALKVYRDIANYLKNDNEE